MIRSLLAASTLALAVPALAWAQHPSSSAKPHPAASAHANAVAGQDNAARIEACLQDSKALLDNLERGDFQAATRDFDAQMLAAVDAHKLGDLWQSIGTRFGKLESRGEPQNMMYQGRAIITVPLRFHDQTIGARTACNADGKIAGFHLVPIPSAAPAESQ